MNQPRTRHQLRQNSMENASQSTDHTGSQQSLGSQPGAHQIASSSQQDMDYRVERSQHLTSAPGNGTKLPNPAVVSKLTAPTPTGPVTNKSAILAPTKGDNLTIKVKPKKAGKESSITVSENSKSVSDPDAAAKDKKEKKKKEPKEVKYDLQ